MHVQSFALPRALVNQLLHLAQASPQREVCGLIGARDGLASRCYPVQNIAEDPARRFLLDPAEQIEAVRTIRAAGESLFGVFHSHPSAPAEPSPADLAELGEDGLLYLIISLNTKGVLEMRGFVADSDRSAFREVELALAH